jgi:hypothetical protein
VTRLLNRLVIIDATGARARITSPFKASTIIKSLFWKARRWDPQRKVWWVDLAYLDALIRDLVAAGFEVDLADRNGMHQAVTRVPAGWSA